ncbi:MAG: hypothetical protein KDK66_07575, partial [Deltaproteobacteria bacterium]|nr:hypothetical protein [Deltaproteobacteria bacterium]
MTKLSSTELNKNQVDPLEEAARTFSYEEVSPIPLDAATKTNLNSQTSIPKNTTPISSRGLNPLFSDSTPNLGTLTPTQDLVGVLETAPKTYTPSQIALFNTMDSLEGMQWVFQSFIQGTETHSLERWCLVWEYFYQPALLEQVDETLAYYKGKQDFVLDYEGALEIDKKLAVLEGTKDQEGIRGAILNFDPQAFYLSGDDNGELRELFLKIFEWKKTELSERLVAEIYQVGDIPSAWASQELADLVGQLRDQTTYYNLDAWGEDDQVAIRESIQTALDNLETIHLTKSFDSFVDLGQKARKPVGQADHIRDFIARATYPYLPWPDGIFENSMEKSIEVFLEKSQAGLAYCKAGDYDKAQELLASMYQDQTLAQVSKILEGTIFYHKAANITVLGGASLFGAFIGVLTKTLGIGLGLSETGLLSSSNLAFFAMVTGFTTAQITSYEKITQSDFPRSFETQFFINTGMMFLFGGAYRGFRSLFSTPLRRQAAAEVGEALNAGRLSIGHAPGSVAYQTGVKQLIAARTEALMAERAGARLAIGTGTYVGEVLVYGKVWHPIESSYHLATSQGSFDKTLFYSNLKEQIGSEGSAVWWGEMAATVAVMRLGSMAGEGLGIEAAGALGELLQYLKSRWPGSGEGPGLWPQGELGKTVG